MDTASHIENKFYIKCFRRDISKLSSIYRKEYLIDEIMKIIDEIYNDNDNDNIKIAKLPNYNN